MKDENNHNFPEEKERLHIGKQIDADLLKKICKILNYNFFDLYSKDLQLDETDKIQIGFKLYVSPKDQIEGNICQYCELNKIKTL
ncbi:MAG: hypothetical protein LBP83_05970 [Dysgonamonadaceae bacterium]|jgi:hypothetical protein|nr:hypothetical protein [Dysgonamonadaceae bacterium]